MIILRAKSYTRKIFNNQADKLKKKKKLYLQKSKIILVIWGTIGKESWVLIRARYQKIYIGDLINNIRKAYC
jgi:hypothetical protein